MNQLKRIVTFLMAAVFVTLVGCSGNATRETPAEYVSDAWITTKVKAALVEDPLVKATEVNVETFKGEVQLSGFISSEAARVRAVRVARDIQGVTAVRNDMRIK